MLVLNAPGIRCPCFTHIRIQRIVPASICASEGEWHPGKRRSCGSGGGRCSWGSIDSDRLNGRRDIRSDVSCWRVDEGVVQDPNETIVQLGGQVRASGELPNEGKGVCELERPRCSSNKEMEKERETRKSVSVDCVVWAVVDVTHQSFAIINRSGVC